MDIWNNCIANKSSYLTGEINAKVLDSVKGYKRIWIYLNNSFPDFPYEIYGEPDITKIYILVKISAPQVTYGSRVILKWGYGQYNDSKIIRKTNTDLTRNINAYGPWIIMDVENTFLIYDKGNFTEKDNQTHFGKSGYMKLKIIAINSGSKDAYQTSYKYKFSKYVEIINNFGDLLDKKDIAKITKNESSGETIVSFNSNRQIPQNTKDAYIIFLKYDFGEDENGPIITGRKLDDEDKDKIILKSADVTLCQDVECNEDNSFVNQFIELNFKVPSSQLIDENQDLFNEPIEEDIDSATKSNSKNLIIGLVITSIVIIGIIIYLILDFKKKLFIFKNRPDYLSPREDSEKQVDPDKLEKVYTRKKHNIKNQKTKSISLEMKTP